MDPLLPKSVQLIAKNEVANSVRDLFPAMALLLKALRTGLIKPDETEKALEGLSPISRARIAYLIDLATSDMNPDLADEWRLWLIHEEHPAERPPLGPFFHADRPANPLYDDVARLYGLSRGADLQKLRQLRETGIG